MYKFRITFKIWQKISGHICQGHVDTVQVKVLIKKIDKSYFI